MNRTIASALAAAVLLAVPTARAEEWVMARSAHFLVLSDAGEKTARRAATELERFRGLFLSVLKMRVDPGIPIIVFAVDDEDGMKELLPWYWERSGGPRPAGVFLDRSDKVYVVLRTDVSGYGRHSVVYHECVHLMTSLNFRWLPVWLSEGLAEFYATADIDDETARFGQMLPAHVQLMRRTWLPIRDLLRADRFSPLYQESSRTTIFYAQSAALTHFLMLGDKKKDERSLARYVQLVAEGSDEGDAEAALGDLDRLERDFRAYVNQVQFQGVKTRASLDAGAIQTFPVSAAAAAAVRGDFLALWGRLREATALVEEAVRLEPALSLAHEARGQVLWRQGRNEDAARSFQEAGRLEPGNFLAPYYEARARRGLPGPDPRRELGLRRSIELNPLFAPAHAALADVLAEEGRSLDEAVQLVRRAVELRPDTTEYWLILVKLLRRTGQEDEAARLEADLERVARADPDTLTVVAYHLDESGRTADAERLLRESLARNPAATMVAHRLGQILMRRDRPDDAEAVLKTAIAEQPKAALLLNELSYLNADRNVRVEEALELVERALEIAPEDASFLDTKGWALHRLGRQQEAERYLREALAREESPVIIDHLGDVLMARGAVDDAIEQWQRARDRSGLSDELRESLNAKIESARAAKGDATTDEAAP